jgi:hypothetical protein
MTPRPPRMDAPPATRPHRDRYRAAAAARAPPAGRPTNRQPSCTRVQTCEPLGRVLRLIGCLRGEERFDLRTPYFAPVVEIHLESRWLAQRWVLTRTEEVMGRPRHRVESQVSCPKPVVSATGSEEAAGGCRRTTDSATPVEGSAQVKVIRVTVNDRQTPPETAPYGTQMARQHSAPPARISAHCARTGKRLRPLRRRRSPPSADCAT